MSLPTALPTAKTARQPSANRTLSRRKMNVPTVRRMLPTALPTAKNRLPTVLLSTVTARSQPLPLPPNGGEGAGTGGAVGIETSHFALPSKKPVRARCAEGGHHRRSEGETR
jgi:hypothetical protein